MLAWVLDMALCLCLSVISRCSIEKWMDGSSCFLACGVPSTYPDTVF